MKKNQIPIDAFYVGVSLIAFGDLDIHSNMSWKAEQYIACNEIITRLSDMYVQSLLPGR